MYKYTMELRSTYNRSTAAERFFKKVCGAWRRISFKEYCYLRRQADRTNITYENLTINMNTIDRQVFFEECPL